jgi:ribosome assembly protein RRB1
MNGVLNPEDTVFDKRLEMDLHKKDKFPLSVYFCGGSQSDNKAENKIYVMKWSDMHKTQHDDDSMSEHSDEDEETLMNKMNNKIKEPVIRFESIPHRGAVNRIRSLHGSSIVATWSEDNEVGIYNISSAIEDLNKPA